MATIYYKIVEINEYASDLETQLNSIGTGGWELSGIYNTQAVFISGASGINVTGSVVLPAGVISSSTQVNFVQIQNTANIVSSSTQVQTLLPGGVVSSSAQYPGWMTSSTQVVWSSVNYNTGIISSSTQLPAGIVSSSAQYPGWVTSSTQVNTGSFSGSFIGTASWATNALTASYVPVSALPFDTGAFATTGSNIFKGNQIITGSLTVSASATFTNIGPAIFSGSITSSNGVLLGGDIIPLIPSQSKLGSLTSPFAEIFVKSGSIFILSDIPGAPAAKITNTQGDVSIESAGFSLISASLKLYEVNSQGQIKIKNGFVDPNKNPVFSIIGNSYGSSSLPINTGGIFQATGFDGIPARLVVDSYGDATVYSQLNLRNANGTAASPTTTVAGPIGRLAGTGWISGSGFGITGWAPPTYIDFYASKTFESASRPTEIRFYTTPSGSAFPSHANAIISPTGLSISGSVSASGTLTASLQEGYTWVGGANNVSTAVPTSSFVAGALAYGQWHSDTTQSGSANTAYTASFDSQSFARGFTLVSGSRLTALQSGVYNFQFSAQLRNTANTNIEIDMWFKKNGVNENSSNTKWEVDKQPSTFGSAVAALNYMVSLNSGSYLELVWSSNAATAQLFATGSVGNPTRPAIPSVIMTVSQVG